MVANDVAVVLVIMSLLCLSAKAIVISVNSGTESIWPQSAAGPESCWKTSSLRDIRLGWLANCSRLRRTGARTALHCKESCMGDSLCGYWRYDLLTQCWHGGAEATCSLEANVSAQRKKGLLVSGAQQLQHGDVHVLRNLQGWEVFGLQPLMLFVDDGVNMTARINHCRLWCYSNIRCRFWEMIETTCWVEGQPGALPVLGDATNASTFALKVVAGEHIEHTCPRAPPRFESHSEPRKSAETQNVLVWAVVGIAYVLLFWFGPMCVMMEGWRGRQCRRQFVKLVLTEGHDDDGSSITDSTSDDEEQEPGCWSAVCWRLPFLPALSIFAAARLEPPLDRPFATKEERGELLKAFPDCPPSVVAYMSWRRCTLAMLLTIGVGYYLMQLRMMELALEHRAHFLQVSQKSHLQSFEAWVVAYPDIPGFLDYSMEKLWALFAGILAEVLRGFVFAQVTVCVLQLLPLVLLLYASRKWTCYVASRRFLLAAWGIAFATPLAVSMVPIGRLVDFSDVANHVDAYVQEFAVALHLDQAQQLLLHACDEVSATDFEPRVKDFGSALRGTCDIISTFPMTMTVTCGPTRRSTFCALDLSDVIGACQEAVRQFELGNAASASKIAEKTCHEIQDMFTTADADRIKGRAQAFNILIESFKLPAHNVLWGIGILMIAGSLVHVVFALTPPVAAVLPAFVNAAIATKALFPHSALPGVVIVIGPVFFLTGAWIVATIAIHYASNPLAHSLLLCSLAGPTAFVVCGAMYKVTQPIGSARFKQAACILRCIFYVTFIVSFTILMYLLHQFRRFVEDAAVFAEWLRFSWASSGLSCAMGMVYFYALTSFGAIDWMVLDVSKQKRYWHSWANFEKEATCEATDNAAVESRSVSREPMIQEEHRSKLIGIHEDSLGGLPVENQCMAGACEDLSEPISRTHLHELFRHRAFLVKTDLADHV